MKMISLYNKFKSKQLKNKFSKLEFSLNEQAQEYLDKKKEVIEIAYIDWRKELQQSSYSNWVFTNFYTNLQLFFMENLVEIEEKKFTKDSKGNKKLILILKTENTFLKENILNQLKTLKVEKNLRYLHAKKISDNKLIFKVVFEIIEEENEPTENRKEQKENINDRGAFRDSPNLS